MNQKEQCLRVPKECAISLKGGKRKRLLDETIKEDYECGWKDTHINVQEVNEKKKKKKRKLINWKDPSNRELMNRAVAEVMRTGRSSYVSKAMNVPLRTLRRYTAAERRRRAAGYQGVSKNNKKNIIVIQEDKFQEETCTDEGGEKENQCFEIRSFSFGEVEEDMFIGDTHYDEVEVGEFLESFFEIVSNNHHNTDCVDEKRIGGRGRGNEWEFVPISKVL